MKNINQLGMDLEKAYMRLERNLMNAQRNTAKKIKEDVIKNLNIYKGKYVKSIKQGETKKEQNRVYKDINKWW